MKVIFFILDYANFIVNDGKIADPPVLSKTYFIFALLLFCKDTFRKYFKIRYNTQAKFEINREEGLNPIKQDLENGEPRCHPEIVKLQCIIHVKAIFFVCQSHIFLQSWSIQLQHFTFSTFEIFPMWNSNINLGRFLPNIFPWHGHPCNYGAFPQTWENPYHTDSWTGLHGDKVAIWEYLYRSSACWFSFNLWNLHLYPRKN